MCQLRPFSKKLYITGNAFIVNVALADLLVTSILMPASTIVLLAGIDAPLSVCRVQWFFAACAFLTTILSLAVSTYSMLCNNNNSYLSMYNNCVCVHIDVRFTKCKGPPLILTESVNSL